MPPRRRTATLESPIERVVHAIGRYYGAISRDNFVSMLLQRETNLPANMLEPPPLTPPSLAASAIMSMADGGFTTPHLISQINEMAAGGRESGNTIDSMGELANTIKICYEPGFPNESNIILTRDNSPEHRNGVRQGFLRGDNSYSMKHIAGLDDSTVNNNSGNPSESENTLSVIQVMSNRFAPANRDMGALTLFMNAIPTLELSRAVPFIDVVLIQEGPALDGNNRISSLSLGQFLLGNSVVNDDMQRTIIGARDAAVVSSNQADPEFERSRRSDGNDETVVSPISTAGMELFTSPQTLVSADEVHVEDEPVSPSAGSDPDARSASAERQTRRAAPVIDRFRPLMTLRGLSLSVVPSGGMMSYKSGKMSLTLHDRSRLAEIAAFVRPARYGTTHLLIEYGWAHPDSQAQQSASDTDPTNLFGAFIGSMRSREKYQIVNSSFSFDDVGQVEIDLTLSMLSARAARQVHIGLGIENTDAYQTLKQITDMISVIRERMDSTTAQALGSEGDILGALSDPRGALGIDRETRQSIQRLVRASRTSHNSTLRELGGNLERLVGTTGGRQGGRRQRQNAQQNTTSQEKSLSTQVDAVQIMAASDAPRPSGRRRNQGGAIENLRSSISAQIEARCANLTTTSDPFFLVVNRVTQPIINPSAYISLGKIISVFVGAPAAESGYYKDVQIIFYNFNDKASWMANRNIATFPVPKQDFQETLKDELDQLVNMPLQAFIEFMSSYFISDNGAHAYGFQSLYEERDDEDRTRRQLVQRYREDSQGGAPALFEAEQEVLREAYNNQIGSLEFKMPTIQMHMEAVPERSTLSGEDGSANTILRIHVFDSQATSHTTLQSFLEASSSRSFGLINTAAQAAAQSINEPVAPGSSAAAAATSVARREFENQLQTAERLGLIEEWPPTSSTVQASTDAATASRRPVGSRYRLRGGFSALKNYIMRTMPSVRYGEGSSGIISAKVTSMQDAALTTVNMMRQADSPDTPAGTRQRGLPLMVAPVECTLETFGCPLWNFGQQIFIDFGTGTTVDAIYGVVGIEHQIGPGEFKSSVKLTPMNSYARYTSLFDNIETALTAVEGIEGNDTNTRRGS